MAVENFNKYKIPYSQSGNKTIHNVYKTLQSLSFGLLPDRDYVGIPDHEVSKAVDVVYSHLAQLNNSQKAKLNNVMNELESYAMTTGSPSLQSFILSRKKELQNEANKIEKSINNLDLQKTKIDTAADDIRGTEIGLRHQDSDVVKDFSKIYEQSVNLTQDDIEK